MDLKKFLELPATGDFRLLNKIDNITDIPVENISLLEPPVEKFVRRHEIILSQALTVRDNETDLKQFIEELYLAGASAAAYVLKGEASDTVVLDLVPGNGVGYTVPQRVRPADVDKGVEISFRVRQNYGPSQITITCGEKQLARFKRQRMAPGEMEHITLPGVLLAKADGPLTVAVEEVVAK